MRSGDRPGLQNRRAAGNPVTGGFDPHSLPPLLSLRLTRITSRRTRQANRARAAHCANSCTITHSRYKSLRCFPRNEYLPCVFLLTPPAEFRFPQKNFGYSSEYGVCLPDQNLEQGANLTKPGSGDISIMGFKTTLGLHDHFGSSGVWRLQGESSREISFIGLSCGRIHCSELCFVRVWW